VKEITMNSPSEPEKGEHGQKPERQPQSSSEPEVTAGNSGTEPADGWIEQLAKRSTGLPEHQQRDQPADRKGDTSLWRLAGLGIQFAATVAIFAWMGNALDKRMGWSPWGLVTLSLIAVVGNLYLLIKESLQQDSPTKKPGVKNVGSDARKRSSETGGRGPSG
jgi:F0F1-type ATP synthase assembly protein I